MAEGTGDGETDIGRLPLDRSDGQRIMVLIDIVREHATCRQDVERATRRVGPDIVSCHRSMIIATTDVVDRFCSTSFTVQVTVCWV